MDRQARTGDTVLVKRRDDWLELHTAVVAGGWRGKDDRKQNILAPLALSILRWNKELKERLHLLL